MHITEDHTNVLRRRRRQHSAEFKAELVAAALQPGASVSALALAHGLNANLLFAWRRAHLRSQAHQVEGQPAPTLLPVQVVTAPADAGDNASVLPAAPASPPVTPQHAGFDPRVCSEPSTGHIELHLGGADLRLHGRVDEITLRLLLQWLRPRHRAA